MKQEGLTLIEVIVVMVTIGILVAVAGTEYASLMASYRAESQIKTMYADVMRARHRAMQKNVTHFLHLEKAASHGYAVYSDADNNDKPDTAIDTKMTQLSKQDLQYGIAWNGGGDTLNISADRRGLIAPSRSLWLLKTDGAPFRESEVDYDCIIISSTRINLGKYYDVTQSPPCQAK
jgi:prepilin-type N-terminal cleavage/methylation domain-containing protein